MNIRQLLIFSMLSMFVGCVEVYSPSQTRGPSTSPPASGTPSNAGTSSASSIRALYTSYHSKNFRGASAFQEKVNASNIDYRKLHAVMYFMINEAREKRQKPILPYHERLEVAAYFHSEAMVKQDFFSHQNPKSSSRKTTTDRGKLAGIANPMIAENIVYTYTQNNPPSYLEIGDAMMDSWMKSEGHKKNILSEKAQQVGCGAYFNGENWYGTQVFQWYSPVELSESPKDHF